jgi:hypothetical protein
MKMSLEAAIQTLCHVGTMRSVCGFLDCGQPVFLNPCLECLLSVYSPLADTTWFVYIFLSTPTYLGLNAIFSFYYLYYIILLYLF